MDPTPLPAPVVEALKGETPSDREALADTWQRFEPLTATPAIDTESAWGRLQERLGLPSDSPAADPVALRSPEPPARRHRIRRGIWTTVALAGLIALVATVWWMRPVTLEAAHGTQLTAQLPDGSTVTLNSGSTLSYPRQFAALWGAPETRTVQLDGEAYFDVTTAEAPFRVETFNARIEVLGTVFNVLARPDRNVTDVALLEGRVQLSDRNGSTTVELAPGQSSRAVSTPDGTEVHQPDAANVSRETAWRSGGLAFDAARLSDVLAEISRRYDTEFDVTLEVSTDLSTTAFFATRPALADLLADLGASWNVRFVPIQNGYRVENSPAQPR